MVVATELSKEEERQEAQTRPGRLWSVCAEVKKYSTRRGKHKGRLNSMKNEMRHSKSQRCWQNLKADTVWAAFKGKET